MSQTPVIPSFTCGNRGYVNSVDAPNFVSGSSRTSSDAPSDTTLPPLTVFMPYQIGSTAPNPVANYPQDNFGWSGGDSYGNYCNCTGPDITKMHNPTGYGSGGAYGGTPDQSGALWQGCGHCQPSSEDNRWDCCGCCIKTWNPLNKENCCNPTGTSIPEGQYESAYCDPNWCPWSDACLTTNIMAEYCKNNPTNANCLNACMRYASANMMAQAPSWCQSFISLYCKTKSANSAILNSADATICACSLNLTPSDECLSAQCKFAPDGGTWNSAQQYKNKNDPSYCTTECKSITAAVEANNLPSVNQSQYSRVCGNAPLPGAGGGNSGGGGGGTNITIPTYGYVLLGGGAIILLIGLLMWLLRKQS